MFRPDVLRHVAHEIPSWSVPRPAEAGERRLWRLIAVALTAGYLLPIWLVKYVPLQDYPYHLLRMHIIADYANPVFHYSRIFTVSLFPLPYILFDYLVLLGAMLFSIPIAGKIALTIYVVLFIWSIFYFVGGIGRDHTLLGFFGFLLVYNWHFNKGFANFVLGIPFFFFAVGYYWRHREALTWPRGVALCALILATYLAHAYAFGFLLYALILLALLMRRVRPLAVVILASLPTLGLFGLTMMVQRHSHMNNTGLLVLEYPTLRRTLELALRPDLPYFTSFAPSRERWILLASAILVLLLVSMNARSLRRNAFTVLVAAFAVLYLVLPEYVSPDYNYFACRVLIFIPLLTLALLRVPRTPLVRTLVLVVLVTMTLGSLALTARAYVVANRSLRDYAAALEHIPARQAIWFAEDTRLAYIGRMTPFAFFNGYYYLTNAGRGPVDDTSFIYTDQYMASGASQVPSLAGVAIGTLRSVQLRSSGAAPSDDAVRIDDIFARPEIDVGGIAIAPLGGRRNEVQAIAERHGYVPVVDVAGVVVYRRREHPASPVSRGDLGPLYRSKDYLLIYEEAARIPPEFSRDFDLVFSQGDAHLFRRRTS